MWFALIDWLFGDGLYYKRQFDFTAPKRGETDKQYAKRLRQMHPYTFLGER